MKAQTYISRHKLPKGPTPFQGKAALTSIVLTEFLQYDPLLELHEFPGGTVHAYRRKFASQNPTDILCHQFALPAAPGAWLLSFMRKADGWRNRSPERHVIEGLKALDWAEEKRLKQEQNELDDLTDQAKKDAITYAWNNKRTFDLGKKDKQNKVLEGV